MSNMGAKEVILHLSNKTDVGIVNNFNNIVRATTGKSNCIFIYHNNSTEIPECIKLINHYIFTDHIFDELPYIPLSERSIIPGCDHFPLLKFYLENPNYDYYWSIEDDVRFHGDWDVLFDTFRDNDADFISAYINTYEGEPNWCWWNSLKHVSGKTIELQDRMKSFNPIRRLSNRAMESLHRYMSDGWYGHQEVLMPTIFKLEGYKIIDMGGRGPFVPEGFEYRFYDNDSHSHIPVAFGDKLNFIYHPIKEMKRPEISIYKRNCIISAVGRGSLHRKWINDSPDFDLHLLIYDDSYSYFFQDSPFIFCQKGYKLKLVYDYLQKNPDYLEKYDYFFLPDDDINMPAENIHALFEMMREYKLEIAQPALIDSYYTYEHTLKQKYSTLRYVNFVEMMLPCFSRDALKKVLFTFNENRQGWGSEYHWSSLIDFTGKEMAILDKIEAVHTRPVQSFSQANHNDGLAYIKKYNLNTEIIESGFVPSIKLQKNINNKVADNKELYDKFIIHMEALANQFVTLLKSQNFFNNPSGKFGISLFFLLYYQQTGKRKYQDIAVYIVDKINDQAAALLKDNLDYLTGLTGFSWYIEYLAQNGYIENETDEILEEICQNLNSFEIVDFTDCSLATGLTGLAQHYLTRLSNSQFNVQKNINKIERDRLLYIADRIVELFLEQAKNKLHLHEKSIIDSVYFLCQTNKLLPDHPKLIFQLEQLIDILSDLNSIETAYCAYKAYVFVLASEIIQKSEMLEKALSQVYKNASNHLHPYQNTAIDLFLYNQLYLKTNDVFYKSRTLELIDVLLGDIHKKISNNSILGNQTDFIEYSLQAGLSMLSVLSGTVSNLDWEFNLLNCEPKITK